MRTLSRILIAIAIFTIAAIYISGDLQAAPVAGVVLLLTAALLIIIRPFVAE